MTLENHAIVVGYGLAGRTAVEQIRASELPFVIIELNEDTVDRCSASGLPMLVGEAREVEMLKRAGVENAKLLVITIPDDRVVLDIIKRARILNPTIHMVARCAYTSTGMIATQLGAEVVVAEQIVAREIAALLKDMPQS